MKKYLALFFVIFFAVSAIAQTEQMPDSSSLDLAKATLKAHGGEKLQNVKTLIVRGSAELSAGTSAQTIPAAFATTFSGEKYRFDIQSQFFNFKQIFDGVQTYSSIGGFSVPLDKTGLSLLVKVNQNNYRVSALPEKLKKKKGFRITSPEGFYTDFMVDEKTGLVKEFESSYEVDGGNLTTSVAIDKYREVEGIWINEKFSQRLETPQGSFYASFKAQDILINSEIANDVFEIPK